MSGSAASVGSSLSAASSINDVRTKAHLVLGQRLGGIDLSPLLIYTFQNTPDSALPFLAWQFDVLAPWWQLLTGPESQLQLIQQAIALHRYKGTVYAIEAVLSALGFGFLTIQEGQESWGGMSFSADQGWAVYRVSVSKADVVLADPQPASWDGVTDVDLLLSVDDIEQATSITGMIVMATIETQAIAALGFFAPARCWLDSLWFNELPVQDTVAVSDAITVVASNYILEKSLRTSDLVSVQGWALADTKATAPLYDAHFRHAGLTYGASEPAMVDSGLVINSTPTE